MADSGDHTISQMTLVDWLDDLTVRFLLNLPPAELSSVPRLCFQVEEAQWFYEDFIRPANPALPSLNLRQFCLTLFQHCPLLSGFNAAQHLAAYEEFLAYKVRVPVRGAILMDESMDKVLLVRGWKKGASWSFPRGKINKDEPDLDCAIREVYEETGFDLHTAGLVERNKIGDGKVKAIDVTMREQHMKLFVFRGVALDTYFEPRTRKEISKIQWYNVKDLPGFKKQKGVAGHGQGEAESVKFYMVAPFLGHLKKWIGHQRRKDSAEATQARHGRNISLSNEGVHATITEDEAEDTEAGFATDNGVQSVERNAEELKRLLSIGGPAPAASQSTQFEQSQLGAQTNSLLAMLKGSITAPAGSSLPHTPYGQVDPVFPEHVPQTPQLQHPRHASEIASQYQHAPSQFQYSPQTLQQGLQQQQVQMQSSMFNTGIASQQNYQQPGFSHLPPHLQQQLFQQQQRQQRLPTSFSPGQGPGVQMHPRPNSSGFQQIPQLPSTYNANALDLPPHLKSMADQNVNPVQPFAFSNIPQHRPLSEHAPPIGHVPIGSEKAAPEASKLPPPRLNAHSLKLLDAFKTGPRAPRAGSSSKDNVQQQGYQHQTTLLDLFRKPSTTASPPAPAEKEATQAPTSPALTDATAVPAARDLERKPALNENTRTIPPKSKATSPALPVTPEQLAEKRSPFQAEQPLQAQAARVRSSARGAQGAEQVARPHLAQAERPKSRGHLFDPAQPKKFVPAPSQAKQSEAESSIASSFVAQRPSAQYAGRPPRSPRPIARSAANPSPKPRNKQTRNENGQPRQAQPMPQFSILQRPGSSRSTAPLSPLRDGTPLPGQQPQVLKRQPDKQEDETTTTQRQSDVVSTPAAGDKKDQLLALFGKAPLTGSAASEPLTSPVPSLKHSSAPSQPQSASLQKNPLLDLFNGNRAEVAIKTPEPPPSPQLLPERKSPAQGQRTQHSQQHLLNLFTKSSTSAGSRLNSPGTPISPFTLGTPATNISTEKLPNAVYDSSNVTPRVAEPRSRLGSMASVMSNGTGSRSGAQTPIEAKDLLLGYLNGVVQKEGYRGAKKPA